MYKKDKPFIILENKKISTLNIQQEGIRFPSLDDLQKRVPDKFKLCVIVGQISTLISEQNKEKNIDDFDQSPVSLALDQVIYDKIDLL